MIPKSSKNVRTLAVGKPCRKVSQRPLREPHPSAPLLRWAYGASMVATCWTRTSGGGGSGVTAGGQRGSTLARGLEQSGGGWVSPRAYACCYWSLELEIRTKNRELFQPEETAFTVHCCTKDALLYAAHLRPNDGTLLMMRNYEKNMRFSHVILSRNLSLFAGEVHANLGRFFYLEWRFPLGTYHLSKVLPMRWLEWGCFLNRTLTHHIVSYRIIFVSYRIVSYRIVSYHCTDW